MRMQAQVSVAVGCRQEPDWTIYVPVTVQSRIRVWALRTPEVQGARLTAGDVAPETRLVGGLPIGYVTDPAQLSRATLRAVHCRQGPFSQRTTCCRISWCARANR